MSGYTKCFDETKDMSFKIKDLEFEVWFKKWFDNELV